MIFSRQLLVIGGLAGVMFAGSLQAMPFCGNNKSSYPSNPYWMIHSPGYAYYPPYVYGTPAPAAGWYTPAPIQQPASTRVPAKTAPASPTSGANL